MSMEPHYLELGAPAYITSNMTSLCRVCACHQEYFIQLFSEEGKNHGLIDKINRHLPITVSENDIMPTQICYQCASTLLSFSDLIDTCLVAEKRLHYLLNCQTEVDKEDFGKTTRECLEPSEQASEYDGVTRETMSGRIDDTSSVGVLTSHDSVKATEDTELHGEHGDFFDDKEDEEEEEEEPLGEDEFGDDPATQKKKKKRESISKCSICGRVFQFVQYLRSHMLTHSGNRPHACHICGAKFKRKDHINHHRKTVHMNHPDVLKELEKKGNGYLTCEQCGVVKPTKHLMVLHQRKHSFSSKCDVCGECFNLPAVLKEHLISQHSSIDVFCPICGESMKTGKELYFHKQRHFNSFICDVCGKPFALQSTLRAHMIVHSDERPFSCGECGASFKLKVRLRLHIQQAHTDERPYACTVCKDKRFKTKTALQSHNNMHNDTRLYPCPHCSFRARKNSDLVNHIRTHTGEKPYKCDICGRGFAQASDMRKHRATHQRHRLDAGKK